jgi:L-ascorbate metabolism protein UlaG (beta-lactamase superfamily)
MDSLTFIGTATTLVRLGSFTLLTDPNFLHRGQRAYLGKGLWSRRLTDPAMSPAQLPPLDAVVLSHLHGDHWDRVATRELDRSPPVFTTVKAATRLSRYGFDGRGMRTWDETVLRRAGEELRIVSLPGIHARGLLGPVLPPVMGSMLEHTVDGHVRIRVYLSGDTLDGTHLDAVRERFPDIDVAVVHLGGTRVLAHMVTMDDVQGVRFLRRIQPSVAVPVHYDDYRIFRSPLQRFVDRAGSSALATDVRVVGRGDTVALRPHESPDRSS